MSTSSTYVKWAAVAFDFAIFSWIRFRRAGGRGGGGGGGAGAAQGGGGFVAGAGGGGPASPDSPRTRSTDPTLTTSPSFARSSRTVPVTGDGIWTVTLSVMTSTMGSSSLIGSPGFTNHLTTSPSWTPSPMSGSLNSRTLASPRPARAPKPSSRYNGLPRPAPPLGRTTPSPAAPPHTFYGLP